MLKTTSEIISTPKDWADRSILIPHEVIRHATKTLLKFFDADADENPHEIKIESNETENINTQKFKKIKEWYEKNFYPFISHHHKIEEEIYFPFLATKCEIPKKLQNDHDHLMKQLDKIKNSTDFAEMKKHSHQLSEDMLRHLA